MWTLELLTPFEIRNKQNTRAYYRSLWHFRNHCARVNGYSFTVSLLRRFLPDLAPLARGFFFPERRRRYALPPPVFASTRPPASIRTRLDSIARTVGKHGHGGLHWCLSSSRCRSRQGRGHFPQGFAKGFTQPIGSKMSFARLRASTFRLHVLPLRMASCWVRGDPIFAS
jgi:hypothetical protein